MKADSSNVISAMETYATMRVGTQDTPKKNNFGYRTFYETQDYHMVRNKRGKFYERELRQNNRETFYPSTHVTIVSIDKYSTRPPIYRTDHSPNANRFDNLNLLPQ